MQALSRSGTPPRGRRYGAFRADKTLVLPELRPNMKLAAVFVVAVSVTACSRSSPSGPTPNDTSNPPAATAPVIVGQPQGASIDESQSTTLSVSASGTGPLAFQWYMGPRGVTSSPVAHGTSSTVNTGTLWVTVSFWVRVTNTVGTADSDAATVTVNAVPGPTPTPTPTPGPGPSPNPVEAFEVDVLALVNSHRAAGAVCGTTSYSAAPSLVMDSRLRDAARLHSQDMASQNYFSHTSLDGRTFSQRISATGFNGARPWGENIGAGYPTPQAVVAGLMASPGHCANIMNPSYRAIGVGYAFGATSTYGHYWTQNFAAGQ